MKVRDCFSCVLLGAMATAAHANLIGNPLVPGAEPSDLGAYVYNVYYASPMPSAGTIDAVVIYQMDISQLPSICDSFTLRLLRYTGVGNLYEQYYTSRVLGRFGPIDDVQSYWLGEEVQVQAGDLFATYGQSIPFTADAAWPDTYYFTGSDFAPPDTGLIDLSGQPYTGNRIYSAAVNFTPAPGSAQPVPEVASAALLMTGAICLMSRGRMDRSALRCRKFAKS